jgi:hypothetical protein
VDGQKFDELRTNKALAAFAARSSLSTNRAELRGRVSEIVHSRWSRLWRPFNRVRIANVATNMQTFFRTLNTLFLAGIFSMLILIFLHLEKPIRVDQAVAVQGLHRSGGLEEALRGGPGSHFWWPPTTNRSK